MTQRQPREIPRGDSLERRRSGGPGTRRIMRRRIRGRSRERIDTPEERTHATESAARKETLTADHALGPVRTVGVLLGAGLGMAIAALTNAFSAMFAAEGTATEIITATVVGASALSLAVGVSVPRRAALWIAKLVWHKLTGRGSAEDLTDLWSRSGAADRPLHWVVLAVIALGAGLTAAMLPITLRMAGAVHAALTHRFLWPMGSMAILHSLITAATVIVPLSLFGLAVSCLHHLSCPFGRWETRATGWLLLGVAGGVLTCSWLTGGAARSEVVLATAALPTLAVALLATISKSARAGFLTPDGEADAILLPTWSDRWPRLLRASLVAVGGGAACAATVWMRLMPGDEGPALLALPIMLAGCGIGILIGCRPKRAGGRSIGGFGVACAAAGLAVALGLTLTGHGSRGAAPVRLVLAFLGIGAIGFALAYGHQTLLSRVGQRSYTGAVMLTRTLTCVALVAWFAAPMGIHLIGSHATLATLALSLVLLGGALIIHEPSYSTRTRRARLVAVFASLAVMIAVAGLTPP